MSSWLFAAPNASLSSLTLLPRAALESVIAPLLTTADLLALSSINRATRQLVLTPELWRNKVFKTFPPLSSSTPSLPAWCDVVQSVRTDYQEPFDPLLSLDSLYQFPNLRHLYLANECSSDTDKANNAPSLPSHLCNRCVISLVSPSTVT